jgi:hypothetical protein
MAGVETQDPSPLKAISAKHRSKFAALNQQ